MMITIDEDKAFDKIQYPIATTVSKLGIEENFPNLIKDT